MFFWYHCTRLGISQQDAAKKGEKKICIQHKNMAKQARVYSTTRLTINLFVTAMQLLYNF